MPPLELPLLFTIYSKYNPFFFGCSFLSPFLFPFSLIIVASALKGGRGVIYELRATQRHVLLQKDQRVSCHMYLCIFFKFYFRSYLLIKGKETQGA
jgi:hypothetical protein